MGFHVQLDLKAIEQAPSASGAEGIGFRDHLAGLALMYHHVWTKKSDRATRELLMGWFAVGPEQVPRLVSGLIAFEHLDTKERDHETPCPSGTWRIKGAKRYENLRKALSEGGKKAQAARRARGEQPAVPPATPEGRSGASAEEPPAGKKTRELSDAEQCWDVMERLRVEHCAQLGMDAGESPRPRVCNKKLNDATAAVGIVDSIANGGAFTRWDKLTLFFERYLQQERIGLKDIKTGKACNPPWPIPLFLSAGVLERFKADYDSEETAA